MNITDTKENETVLDETNDFVSKNEPSPGDRHTPAYLVEVPEGYVVGIDAGTPIAPEIRDSSGNPVDDSTRIVVQGTDRQGNPLGDAVVFDERVSALDYDQMRVDEDYARETTDGIMLDEYDKLAVFVVVPDGGNAMDQQNSRLTIGDATSSWGTPVEIVEHDALTEAESAAVKQSSAAKGGR